MVGHLTSLSCRFSVKGAPSQKIYSTSSAFPCLVYVLFLLEFRVTKEYVFGDAVALSDRHPLGHLVHHRKYSLKTRSVAEIFFLKVIADCAAVSLFIILPSIRSIHDL